MVERMAVDMFVYDERTNPYDRLVKFINEDNEGNVVTSSDIIKLDGKPVLVVYYDSVE